MATNGFTIIELLAVIAIIGVLAVAAIPRYIDLADNAEMAITDSIAGALASGASNNYLSRKLNNSLGQPVTNCTDTAGLLQGGLPSGYTIQSNTISPDASVTCRVTAAGGTTWNPAPSATFQVTGIA